MQTRATTVRLAARRRPAHRRNSVPRAKAAADLGGARQSAKRKKQGRLLCRARLPAKSEKTRDARWDGREGEEAGHPSHGAAKSCYGWPPKIIKGNMLL